ncbi:ribokinase [Vitreimonas flagellata]|uniref:ribokinase n=1 Tax=Vitreimonas flagellata TaxID=2560861 RepID=UPI00107568FF|nr:ribokinase [Vitreimonas flagellata]
MSAPRIAVVGSINLDLVVRAPHLPAPGETVGGATFARYPGGKGANQALAARRLGAEVALWGCVGADAFAGEALALLRADGVNLDHCRARDDAPTGVALIAVAESSENQIVVAPGANALLAPSDVGAIEADALLCQLEVPVETNLAAAQSFHGFFAINLAPAAPVPDALIARADLVTVNEGEAACYGDALSAAKSMVAITYGAEGATLFRQGEEIARARPPKIVARDTTGAGDTFSAALTLALIEGSAPEAALTFACIAGALAATREGAQPAMPTRAEVDALLART